MTLSTDRAPQPLAGHSELTEPLGTRRVVQLESPALCSSPHQLHEEGAEAFLGRESREHESAAGSQPRSLRQVSQRREADPTERKRGGTPRLEVRGPGQMTNTLGSETLFSPCLSWLSPPRRRRADRDGE